MKIVGIYDNAYDIPGYENIYADCTGGILFDNGYLLVDEHIQDCCEQVYADWGHLKHETNIMNENFSSVKIEYEETGVCICGKYRYFLPCYNEQNGYYSDKLDLILVDTTQKVKTSVGYWCNEERYKMLYKEITRWEYVPTEDNTY